MSKRSKAEATTQSDQKSVKRPTAHKIKTADKRSKRTAKQSATKNNDSREDPSDAMVDDIQTTDEPEITMEHIVMLQQSSHEWEHLSF